MCGRVGQTASEREIVGKYGAVYENAPLSALPVDEVFPNENADATEESESGLITHRHNISTGNPAIVIHHPDPKSEKPAMVDAMFGFTPAWAKKLSYQINARAEGDQNRGNDPSFKGPWGIFEKPFFKDAIRTARCIIPVAYFIEGPEKERLAKPHVIARDDGSLFSLGGIYSLWANRQTGEHIMTFSVITTAANQVTSAIGHHRAPLLVKDEDVADWLNPETPLERIEGMLEPFQDDRIYAYPVDKKIRTPNRPGKPNNADDLIEPIGPPISPTGYKGEPLHKMSKFSWMFDKDGRLKEEFRPKKPDDDLPADGKGQTSLF